MQTQPRTSAPPNGSAAAARSVGPPKALRMSRLLLLALAVLATSLAGPPPAQAHPLDTYGAGTRGVALGNAVTAAARGPLAAYHTRAGAGGLDTTTLQVGARTHRPQLEVNGASAGLPALGLWEVGLAGPAPLGEHIGARLGYALLLALPQESIYGLRQPDESATEFPLLGSRNQRLVLSAPRCPGSGSAAPRAGGGGGVWGGGGGGGSGGGGASTCSRTSPAGSASIWAPREV